MVGIVGSSWLREMRDCRERPSVYIQESVEVAV